MATDLEKLVVQLDADVRSYQNSLAKANGYTTKWQRQVEQSSLAAERRLQQMSKSAASSLRSVNRGFGDLGKGAAVGLAAFASLDGFKDLIDSSIKARNALKVAGLSGADLTAVYDKLFASAQKNAVPVQSLIELYGRAATIQKELGVSSDDLIKFTDNVGKALRVAGTDAQTASGALLQLSQALGSGTVHAEEFNSIQEGALPILQAAAAGIKAAGGSVAKLKQLVIDGKLSSRDLFNGFLEGSKILDGRLKGSVLTVDQALTKLRNSLQDAAGKLNEVSGISQTAVSAIGGLAQYVEALSKVFTAAASGPIGDYIGKLQKLIDFANKAHIALPGINPLAGLPSPEEIEKLAKAIEVTSSDKLKDAREQLAAQLDQSVPRGPRSPATADQQKQVDALVAGLKAGTVNAEDMNAAFDKLGPKFAKLAEQLKPWIDRLKEAQAIVRDTSQDAADIALADKRTHASGDTVYTEKKFFIDRDAAAARSDLDKDIDARSKVIIAAAAKVGIAINEAAAKIQAKSELAAEDLAKTQSTAVNNAVDLIKGFESFRSKAYFDVNHYRAGYGSDTTTDESGNKHTVTAGTVVTLADADRDLLRRIGEFQSGIRDKIGASTFDAMTSSQQAALTSIAYNYGSLPDRIVAALKTGNAATVATAIKNLGTDNGGINQDRRAQEAKLFISGAPSTVQKSYDSHEDFATYLKEQQQQNANLKSETALRSTLNPLVDDYGRKAAEIASAQDLINRAQKEGIEAGKELKDVQQLLYGDISKLSPAAQAQAEAMRAIALGAGDAAVASAQLGTSQERLKQQIADTSQFGQDIFGGFIRDMRDGASAAEALHNVLIKISDKLLDIGLSALFDGSAPGSGGGLLGSLFRPLVSAFSPTPIATSGGSASPVAAAGNVLAAKMPSRLDAPLRAPAGLDTPLRGGGRSRDTVDVVLRDDSGRMASIADQRIQTHSGTIVNVAVKKSTAVAQANMPKWANEYQQRAG